MNRLMTPAPATRRDSSLRFPVLEGYRGMAATMVVFTHVGFQSGAALRGPWAGPLSRLDFGVAIFFLLSGFLLSRPHLAAARGVRRPPSSRVYLWHRFLRIFPAYWLAVIGAFVLLPENHSWTVGDWLVQVFLLQVYVADGLQPGLTQMWSLCVELTFYLLLPFLGHLILRLRAADAKAQLNRQMFLVGTLIALALAWRVATFTVLAAEPNANYWIPGYLDWFALGIAVAAISVYPLDANPPRSSLVEAARTLARSPGACWLAALSIFWLSTTVLGGPYDLSTPSLAASMTKHIAYGVTACLIMIPAVLAPQTPSLLTAVMTSRPALFLGRISYGIFLWNMCLLQVVYRVLGLRLFGGGFWPGLLITYGLSVLTAWLSFRLLERPALSLRNRVSETRPPRGSPRHEG